MKITLAQVEKYSTLTARNITMEVIRVLSDVSIQESGRSFELDLPDGYGWERMPYAHTWMQYAERATAGSKIIKDRSGYADGSC